jgi:hypothetical protein
MEPESSGFRAEDQLQGGPLQDKTIQTDPARGDVTQDRKEPKVSHTEKVVIRKQDGLIKGYLETRVWEDLEVLLRNAPLAPPQVFRIQRLDTGVVEDGPVSDAKAVFFVKTFEGYASHNELKFYNRSATMHGIWVRIEFKDGEVMEGMVHNSIHYLVDPGFFLHPSDPGSNNKLVYIVKNGLKDCRVIGVRTI